MAANEVDDDDFVICEHGQANEAGAASSSCYDEGDIVFVEALAPPNHDQDTRSSPSEPEDDWQSASQTPTVTTPDSSNTTNKPAADVQQLANTGANMYMQTLRDFSSNPDPVTITCDLLVAALSDHDIDLYSSLFEVEFKRLIDAETAENELGLIQANTRRIQAISRVVEKGIIRRKEDRARRERMKGVLQNVAGGVLGLGTAVVVSIVKRWVGGGGPRAAGGWW